MTMNKQLLVTKGIATSIKGITTSSKKLLVAMPFVTSSSLFLIVRPGAPSSFLLLVVRHLFLIASCYY